MGTLASLTADEIAIACDYVKEQGLDVITPETVLIPVPATQQQSLAQHLANDEHCVPLRAVQKILELYAVTDYFINGVGMQFVRVTPNKFWTNNGYSMKPVTLTQPFYMGVHPVTQSQWQALLDDNPAWFSRTGQGAARVSHLSDTKLAQFPVETVSWHDVHEFLHELNTREISLPQHVYRLPTEAEWEFACRGAPRTQQDCSFRYYFSEPSNFLLANQANVHTGTLSLGRPCAVGSYEPNRLGLYDMHGNVWEWTNQADTTFGDRKMLRGGSWSTLSQNCQAGAAIDAWPTSKNSYIGCRLVLAPVASDK